MYAILISVLHVLFALIYVLYVGNQRKARFVSMLLK